MLFFQTSYSQLTKAKGYQLTKLLQDSEKSVVFFANDDHSLEFANNAIERYKDTVQFYQAPEDELPPGLCKSYPCALGFKGKSPLNLESSPVDSNKFIQWVQRVIEPSVFVVSDQEQLDYIMNVGKPSVFVVDIQDVPSGVPDGIITVFLTSSLLKERDVSVEPGAYVYRATDGMIIPFNKEFQEIVKTSLIPYSQVQSSDKHLIGTFFIPPENEDLVTVRNAALEHLAGLYGEKMAFTIVPQNSVSQLLTVYGLNSISFPFFCVAEKSNPRHRRWIENSQNILNITQLESFIQQILDGKLPPAVISEPIPNATQSEVEKNKIVGLNFKENVFDDRYETIVIFSEPANLACEELQSVITAAGKLLNETLVKFYYIDMSSNDVPPIVPSFDKVPQVMMWPAGKKDLEPAVYNGNYTVPEIIEFVKEHATHDVAVPPYSLEYIKFQVGEYMKQIVEAAQNNEYVKKMKMLAKENEFIQKFTHAIKDFVDDIQQRN